jgi:hypothetical protein
LVRVVLEELGMENNPIRGLTSRFHRLSAPGRHAAAAAAALFALAPACAGLTPPARSSGAAKSSDGVAVAVARQQCTQTAEPDWWGNDLVEEVLEVEVRNASAAPLAVHRDAFRLLTPDGAALRTITWGAADPLTVATGETRAFELRFMNRGSLQCSGEMRLDPDGGVALPDHTVSVGAVRFVPCRAP